MKTDSPMMTAKRRQQLVLVALSLTMLSIVLYFTVRIALFITADYPWEDKIIALFLLVAEIFVLLHSIGYFRNLIRVIQRSGEKRSVLSAAPTLKEYPPVAIIVSSFREPIDIVEKTLICFYNLTYPNKHIYFLDDTRYDQTRFSEEEHASYRAEVEAMCRRIGVDLFRRKWRGAKAGMINDFLAFIGGEKRDGFECTRISEKKGAEKEKYIIVFDADQNPFPDFVEPLIAVMEESPRLAFIQTPQYYTNFESNRVARASGLQQVVFFEYVCEGKGEQDAMFCCGTNVIFRTEALEDVGGLDESSVTEDFATSLHFHLQGWHSKYMRKVCAFGMGPEDLGAFFKQQFRWSLGCVGNSRKIVREFFRSPSQIPFSIWWEYFLSGTYYCIGWAFFVMVLCPVLYLFFWGADLFFLSFILFPFFLSIFDTFVFPVLLHSL